MIVIDKSKPVQQILLTLTESTTIQDVKYLMVLKCDATRSVYKIYLPANLSESIERYDLFQIDTSVFQDMEAGFYCFSIYQQESESTITDENLLGESIEEGKLLINTLKVNQPEVSEYKIYKF